MGIGLTFAAIGDDEVQRRLDRCGQPVRKGDLGIDGQRCAQRERLHGRPQAGVGQDRRQDPAGQLAELLDRRLEVGRQGGQGVPHRRVARLRGGPDSPELHRQRDESLLGAVVEVALDPPALVVGGADDAGTRGAQLRELALHLAGELAVVGLEANGRGHRRDETRVVEQARVVDDRGDPVTLVRFVTARR